MKVGAVNADEHRSLGSQYGVQGFPTIKVFGVDKRKPKDYQGKILSFLVLLVAFSISINSLGNVP